MVTNDTISTSVCFCNRSCKFNIHLKCVGGLFGKQNIGPLIYKCLQIFYWYTFKIPMYFCEYFWKINLCKIKTKIWKLKGLEGYVLLSTYLVAWKNFRCRCKTWKSFFPHTNVDLENIVSSILVHTVSNVDSFFGKHWCCFWWHIMPSWDFVNEPKVGILRTKLTSFSLVEDVPIFRPWPYIATKDFAMFKPWQSSMVEIITSN